MCEISSAHADARYGSVCVRARLALQCGNLNIYTPVVDLTRVLKHCVRLCIMFCRIKLISYNILFLFAGVFVCLRVRARPGIEDR